MFGRALFMFLVVGAGDGARAPTTFEATVAAVFHRHCVRCHGPREQSGGLRLDTYENVLRGGEEGPAIIPGDPNASLLFQKIERRDDPPMPPKKALPAREVAKIRAWLQAGARP
jgi:mono/diheme cytochrome c family protein